MIENVIDGDTAVSVNTILAVAGLALTVGLTAITASITTRMRVHRLEDENEEHQEWRKEHRGDHKTLTKNFHALDKDVVVLRGRRNSGPQTKSGSN